MKKLLIVLWAMSVLVGFAFVIVPEIIKMHGYADKFMHILFACLFILGPMLYFKNLKYTLALAACILFCGVGLEIVQSMLPDRKAELLDIVSNLTGVSLGLITGYFLKSGYNAGAQFSNR